MPGQNKNSAATFQHHVKEESTVVNKSESWTTTIQGHEVHLSMDPDGTHRLSLYHAAETNRLRLGLIQCYPRTVADIEGFAKVAAPLFAELAEALRAIGKDDLRSSFDKTSDDIAERMRLFRAQATPEASR